MGQLADRNIPILKKKKKKKIKQIGGSNIVVKLFALSWLGLFQDSVFI